ncbi:MAG: glycosyltransferase [Planctomycetes bacterium]|nr:glycosyltransferase [Planctomycetota bacterium]
MTRTVLVAGHWDDGPGYPRTELLLAALPRAGFRAEECRVPAPARGTSKVGLVKQPWRWPGYWLATRATRARLVAGLRARLREGGVDAVLVPYPGHLSVRWVRSVWRGPLVLDLFLSAHTTAIGDRTLFAPASIPARLLARIDRRACEAADLVLLDTPEHAALVAAATGLPHRRFDWVPIGDAGPSSVTPVVPPGPGEPLRTLFFGTGVPLHGLPTWIDALARTTGVTLELYGGDEDSRRRAHELLGARVTVGPRFAPMGELRAAIERAHLVLGIAGTSAKAQAVVPFKVAHALAHGRPLVTADTPAIRRWLEPERDAFLVPAGDAPSIGVALQSIAASPARLVVMGEAARAAWQTAFSPAAIEARLGTVLGRALGGEPTSLRPVSARAEFAGADA